MGSSATSFMGSIRFVFWVAFAYLVILLVLGLVYVTLGTHLPVKVPATLGPVPTGVPWFGALGAVLLSLTGVFDHRRNWDSTLKYWHFSRPLIGAALAIVSVLTFQAGILAVNSRPSSSGSILYYLIAFLVGYREETFRELIKRLGDVILGPGDQRPPPVIRELSPATGPVEGGTHVMIAGANFTGATEVRFGASHANFTFDSDAQIMATSPPAATPGPVALAVATKHGSATGASFTYTSAPAS